MSSLANLRRFLLTDLLTGSDALKQRHKGRIRSMKRGNVFHHIGADLGGLKNKAPFGAKPVRRRLEGITILLHCSEDDLWVIFQCCAAALQQQTISLDGQQQKLSVSTPCLGNVRGSLRHGRMDHMPILQQRGVLREQLQGVTTLLNRSQHNLLVAELCRDDIQSISPRCHHLQQKVSIFLHLCWCQSQCPGVAADGRQDEVRIFQQVCRCSLHGSRIQRQHLQYEVPVAAELRGGVEERSAHLLHHLPHRGPVLPQRGRGKLQGLPGRAHRRGDHGTIVPDGLRSISKDHESTSHTVNPFLLEGRKSGELEVQNVHARSTDTAEHFLVVQAGLVVKDGGQDCSLRQN
mmetsp:Transcript_6373/g.14440  ORF Transcript_6373/g.14440 Transcript_6373/m.14440 type:complete len:348 (+) Transcript_6373:310-1353(+)